MEDKKKGHREAVALFRHRVIGEALHLPPGEVEAFLQGQAARSWSIPGSKRTRVAVSTQRDWLAAYREHGFEGLLPRVRSDYGQPRRLTDDVVEHLISIKTSQPDLSVRQVIKRVEVERGAATRLAPSTVHRLFTREGLMQRPRSDSAVEMRRFAYGEAGELWQSDVMYGPKIPDGKRKRQTYFLNILDDATRVVPHAAVAFSEATPYFLPVLRDAILRRGMPRRLFVDNGANYTSKQLKLVCVKLKIHLVHGRVRHPQGKGKIERFHRTVRSGFLSPLDLGTVANIQDLDRKYRTWVEREYHNTPHRGIGHLTPLEKWASCADNIGEVPPASEFFDLFMFEEKRRVDKARTVSLKGHLYEVDASLCGEYVVLRFDPLAPPQRSLKVLHKGKDAGEATYLDERSNARIKRVPIKPVLKFHTPPEDPKETS